MTKKQAIKKFCRECTTDKYVFEDEVCAIAYDILNFTYAFHVHLANLSNDNIECLIDRFDTEEDYNKEKERLQKLCWKYHLTLDDLLTAIHGSED